MSALIFRPKDWEWSDIAQTLVVLLVMFLFIGGIAGGWHHILMGLGWIK